MTFFSRIRNWLQLIPLFVLLGATYWLNQQVLPQPVQADNSKRHDPDAIVENFSATKLNEHGTPSFVMAATKMLHYPDDDSTTLEAPRITLLSAEQPALHATANYGIVSSKGDEVFLHDHVVVLRDASKKLGKLTLQTEYLHIVPDQDWTDTDQAVTIVDARNTLRATGMEMDNKARTLKLLSNVTSEYVPIKQ